MSRPWELVAGSLPWEGQQSLFIRTVTFKRPMLPTSGGLIGYQGVSESTEDVLISGVPANVEIASSGRNSASSGLPGDSPGPIKWTITLPPSAMATMPEIMERDVIYDDRGERFQVSAYQPSQIGARIDCVRLTA